jgi:RimJ/RimL family protein N-acetyltransferase
MLGMRKLEGMRIDIGKWHLRPYREGDLPALLKYADSANVVRHLRDRFPHPYTAADGRRWIAQKSGEHPVTSLVIATPEELIGGIGLELRDDVYRRSAEIGYWLGEPFWGQGIMVAAVNAVVEYAFAELDLVRIHAGVFATNARSARVLEKAGFELEGRLRNAVCKHGELIDELVYARLRPSRIPL